MSEKMSEEILSETGYGKAWEDNGQIFVTFTGSDHIYEITESESERAVDCTVEQALGSWGPTQELRQYLENRGA